MICENQPSMTFESKKFQKKKESEITLSHLQLVFCVQSLLQQIPALQRAI